LTYGGGNQQAGREAEKIKASPMRPDSPQKFLVN